MKDRITSRLHDVKRGFKRRPTFTLILIFTCLIIITFALRPTDPTHSLWLNLLPSPSLQSEHSPAGSLIRPREAYVLYNPASLFPELMDNAHLLTIFGLNRDAELRDPCNRDIIVIVTNSTSPADVKRLEEAGALIFHVPYSLRGLLPTRDGWPERYYYVWDKLWVFTLTDYDRVLYLDSDITFNRPIHPIWDDPNAWPEHLASTSDLKDYGPHESPIADAPYFNSGLMMVRPNMTTFDDLLNVEFTDEEPILWPDQDLLNRYYDRDGPRPWVPLDHHYIALLPKKEDVDAGINILHYKAWQDELSPARLVWSERRERMRGWEMAMASIKQAETVSEP